MKKKNQFSILNSEQNKLTALTKLDCVKLLFDINSELHHRNKLLLSVQFPCYCFSLHAQHHTVILIEDYWSMLFFFFFFYKNTISVVQF